MQLLAEDHTVVEWNPDQGSPTAPPGQFWTLQVSEAMWADGPLYLLCPQQRWRLNGPA